MGNEWFGHDVDTIFSYQTPKVVKVNDRALGFVKFVLLAGIIGYIFVYNMWFKGMHLVQSGVEGIARLQWQEPVNKCNPYHVDCDASFIGIKDLPYCSGHEGDKPAAVVRDCDYFDARELPVNVMEGVLLPTYTVSYKQSRACKPGAPICNGKWKYVNPDGSLQTGTGYGTPQSSTFVADVEDFTLLIDHVFRSVNDKEQASDFMMQGYWKPCADCPAKPIKCVGAACDNIPGAAMEASTKGDIGSFLDIGSRKRFPPLPPVRPRGLNRQGAAERLAVGDSDQDVRSEADFESMLNLAAISKLQNSSEPEVISLQDGDVLSLRTLLSMAGKSLDASWESPDKVQDVETIRYRGIALVVSIKYDNLERWTLRKTADPWYTISVTAFPADTYKHSEVELDSHHPSTRIFTLKYGTMIIVKQTGEMAFFHPLSALIALTSAMALLAVSNTLTEMLMLYVLPRKDAYQELKFQESQDFHAAEKLLSDKASSSAMPGAVSGS